MSKVSVVSVMSLSSCVATCSCFFVLFFLLGCKIMKEAIGFCSFS